MKSGLAPALILALGSSAVAASPARAQRGSFAVGTGLSGYQHPEAAVALDLHMAAEASIGWVRVGGSLGQSWSGGSDDRPPVSAESMAAHAGLTVPIARRGAGAGAREIRGLASVELGRHSYAPDGSEPREFLGPKVTYDGPRQSTRFTGARAGLSFAQINQGAGFVVQFELVGRRDHETVELDYVRESCGGLFAGSTCTTTEGSARAGGRELALLISLGVVVGR